MNQKIVIRAPHLLVPFSRIVLPAEQGSIAQLTQAAFAVWLDVINGEIAPH
jgi:hypothetical protein